MTKIKLSEFYSADFLDLLCTIAISDPKTAKKEIGDLEVDPLNPEIPILNIVEILGIKVRRETFFGKNYSAYYKKFGIIFICAENQSAERFLLAHQLGKMIFH